MRKFGIVLLVLVILSTSMAYPAVAPADSSALRVAEFYIGKTTYNINGVPRIMDCAPYIKNGRTMLPLRYVGYTLGLQDQDMEYRQTWEGKTITMHRPYVRDGKPGFDEFQSIVGKKEFRLNGWGGYGLLDVPPELVKGRTMVPFRAAVQALGGLCYWNPASKCVTIVTWAENPNPVPMTNIVKVVLTKDSKESQVTDKNGNIRTVHSERPACITHNGYMLDVMEYLQLWGIPKSAMLYDEKRGGLMVRGTAFSKAFYDDRPSAPYIYLYVGQKQGWESFGRHMPSDSEFSKVINPEAIYSKDSRLYSGSAASVSIGYLLGRDVSGYWNPNKTEYTVELKE
ncbi:MAG: copper amine oxidase N-terminal domain-containing protein [Candidatus Saccharibacteria bacterium]